MPTHEFARSLRRSDTDAEYKLWYELRGRRLNGYKFVRQYPVGVYVADFACRSRGLIVELDGGQHSDCERDDLRTASLNRKGWSVLRFWNDEVLRDLDPVLETILAALDGRLRHSLGAPDSSNGLRFTAVDCGPARGEEVAFAPVSNAPDWMRP